MPRHSGCRGQYKGSDILRLAVLKYAAVLGAPYVDVEYLAAEFFFASRFSMHCSYNQASERTTFALLYTGSAKDLTALFAEANTGKLPAVLVDQQSIYAATSKSALT